MLISLERHNSQTQTTTNQMTGIEIPDATIQVFNSFKKRNGGKFLTLKINDGMTEVVEDTHHAENDDCWDDFLERLTDNVNDAGVPQARYGFYKVDYEVNGMVRDDLVFFIYCPSDAAIRSRMVYAATANSLKNTLEGLGKMEVQAQGLEDLDLAEIQANLTSGGR
eukprot:TRINITY_DN253_c0_g1_i1.p1 TRINITY_DN253_c0_g1~~TRINITY_DN253_c0_g1_i1.p1  ORF type:complete len:166 (+),score=48.67 TRINITY_DN253_c0_g1_i1:98-595(+)